jgi:prophage regulatory protein
MARQLLRLPSVCERVGFKRSQIYALIKQRQFPEPVHIGARSVAWDSELIDAWVQSRIVASQRVAA